MKEATAGGRNKQQGLVQHFTELVTSGMYRPGQPFPPEVQLAREFGVNRSTIGKALATLVKAGLLVRRQGSGTYVARPGETSPEPELAAVLSASGAATVGEAAPVAPAFSPEGRGAKGGGTLRGVNLLVLASIRTDDPNNPVNPVGEIIAGIESENERAGHRCRITVLNLYPTFTLSPETIGQIEAARPAGILHLAARGLDSMRRDVALLQGLGLPFVVVAQTEARLEADAVSIAQEEFGYLAARHLLELGHRSLLYVVPELREDWLERRIGGYFRALQEAGLPAGESALLRRGTELGHLSGEGLREGMACARHLLRQPLAATGIVAVNDAYAAGMLAGLREAGIAVPEALSLVGTDDHFQFRDCNLTTIRQPFRALGEAGMELLTRRLTASLRSTFTGKIAGAGFAAAEAEAYFEHRMIRPKLVERTTSAPFSAEV